MTIAYVRARVHSLTLAAMHDYLFLLYSALVLPAFPPPRTHTLTHCIIYIWHP
jgi:hypothetical protein